MLLISLILSALLIGGMEVAAGNHGDALLPAVTQRESGRIVDFKTLEYEPNSGSARVYVVVATWHHNRDWHCGKVYWLASAPAAEHWRVEGRPRVVWDQARGDHEPFMTPWWSVL